MVKEIRTIKELKKTIKSCDVVFISPRFGVYDGEVKLAKQEALYMLKSFSDDDTPESAEMGTDIFGWIDSNNCLHM